MQIHCLLIEVQSKLVNLLRTCQHTALPKHVYTFKGASKITCIFYTQCANKACASTQQIFFLILKVDMVYIGINFQLKQPRFILQ